MIDPNEFIITRKRKKYKFAKFHNAENCYEFEEWKQQSADVVEIGAGTGLFSVELATRHPNKTFVAIDVKADRLQKGAYVASGRGLTNLSFVRARADQVDELFLTNSVETIWLTFADPFPKKRSAGRRMTHPIYLKKYRNLLQSGGSFIIKHDNSEFFEWSLEQLVIENWKVAELIFNLHDSDVADEYKIMTTYETRWIDEGRITKLVRATL